MLGGMVVGGRECRVRWRMAEDEAGGSGGVVWCGGGEVWSVCCVREAVCVAVRGGWCSSGRWCLMCEVSGVCCERVVQGLILVANIGIVVRVVLCFACGQCIWCWSMFAH